MPMFKDPKLIDDLCRAIADHAKTLPKPVLAVCGLEARGSSLYLFFCNSGCVDHCFCSSLFAIFCHKVDSFPMLSLLRFNYSIFPRIGLQKLFNPSFRKLLLEKMICGKGCVLNHQFFNNKIMKTSFFLNLVVSKIRRQEKRSGSVSNQDQAIKLRSSNQKKEIKL